MSFFSSKPFCLREIFVYYMIDAIFLANGAVQAAILNVLVGICVK